MSMFLDRNLLTVPDLDDGRPRSEVNTCAA
jgi:hypothetical protein